MADCVIYARVSSKEQEKEGYSIPAQLELLRGYAAKHGLNVKQEFSEAETAGKSGRAQFQIMLELLRKPDAPKVVLVEKTDRLTRNFQDYVLIDELAERGIEFRLIKEGEVIGKNASSHTKLIQGIKVVLAKNYIDNLREETKKGILQKVKQGGWSWRAPFGYKMVKGELEPDPETAPFIQRAYELYSTGFYSLEAVRKMLFDEGFVYKPGKSKIPKTHLHSLLTNRIYIGEVEHQGMVYQGRHQAILPRSQWQAIQDEATKKSRVHTVRKYDFLYTDILTCGACGSLLCGEEKQGGKYIYYRCWQAANGKCEQKYISERKINDALSSLFQRMTFPMDYKKSMLNMLQSLEAAKENTRDDERRRLASQIKSREAMVKTAYYDKMQGLIDDTLWLQIRQECQQEIDRLNAAMERTSKAEFSHYDLALMFFELPEMIAATWQKHNKKINAELIKSITSKISIKDKNADVVLHPALDGLYNYMDLDRKYPEADVLRNLLVLHSETIQRVYQALAA